MVTSRGDIKIIKFCDVDCLPQIRKCQQMICRTGHHRKTQQLTLNLVLPLWPVILLMLSPLTCHRVLQVATLHDVVIPSVGNSSSNESTKLPEATASEPNASPSVA